MMITGRRPEALSTPNPKCTWLGCIGEIRNYSTEFPRVVFILEAIRSAEELENPPIDKTVEYMTAICIHIIPALRA